MHPLTDLSAYLDGALDGPARMAVDGHLASCAACRARLADLRSTASLIRRLPSPSPRRSLVPRVSIPFWLAPVRTLSTIASGAAVVMFLASVAILNAPAGTTATGAAGPGVAAPASAPERNEAPQAAPAASPTVNPATGFALTSATPAPAAAQDQTGDVAKRSAQSEPPAADTRLTASQDPGRGLDQPSEFRPATTSASARPQLGPSPWLWLGAAIGFGLISVLITRRLRTA